MKTSDEDDEPLVVLVLFVLAGLCVLAGLVQGMQMPGLGGILFGCLVGASAGLSFWALAVVIRLLHKIERNTRR